MKLQKTFFPLTTLLVVAILLLPLTPIQAQRHKKNQQRIRAYPAVGATMSQIRGDELRGFKKVGFTAGVGAMVNLSDQERWQLSIEALYSERGAQNRSDVPFALIGFKLQYVDIPLFLHFTDPIGGMTVGLGINYSRMVQQPHGELLYHTSASADCIVPDSSDFGFLRNDLALAVDFRFPIVKKLYLNVRYQHSIIPIKRQWHFTQYHNSSMDQFTTWANDLYNSSLMFRLLYYF